MGMDADKLLKEQLGKSIAVYYNDTLHSVSFKSGKFLDFDENILKIHEQGRQDSILIPRSKLIRIEINSEESSAHAKAQA